MALTTNKYFASASAGGTDWRDTAKSVLEQLQEAITENSRFSLGLIYVTDSLGPDLNSILTLFKTVTKIEHWAGSIGLGVLDMDSVYLEEPAISVLLLDIEEESFCPFRFGSLNKMEGEQSLEDWMRRQEPLFVLTHSGSLGGGLSLRLRELEGLTGGFLTGGVASSRTPIDSGPESADGDISGVAFAQSLPVATALTQGCRPLGEAHTITHCDSEHVIRDLDYKRCYDVFEEDLRTMAIENLGMDPDQIQVSEHRDEEDIWSEIPPEFRDMFQGEVHVAFPVHGSDQNDYLVRNILGFDQEKGLLAVSQPVYNGDRMMFVHRNAATMEADLVRMLMDLRKRIEDEHGSFEPKGALYVSCVARANFDLTESGKSELGLIREVLGPVPLTGYYAGGEILNGRIYGYTGILTLFL